MDFFGLKKRKALKFAVEYMRSILGSMQHISGLPALFGKMSLS
jgi:hypothetical protein